MKKYIFTLLALLMTIPLSAQRKWTLRECIDYAIENNIEIKQQALSVEGAKIDLNTSKMSRLPDLNANVGSQFNFGTTTLPSTNITQSANSFSSNLGISSSIPIFTGFRIPNEIKYKELDLLAATANLSKAKENLELQVTSLYLEVLFKKEILKVYEEQLDLTNKQLEKTRAMVEAGKVPKSQEYDMVAQQAKDELNITTSGNDLDIALLNLSQSLNLPEQAGFDVVEPAVEDQMEANSASLLPATEIYNIAIGIKPHVKAQEYTLEGSRKRLKVAQSGYYPTLTLGGGYSTAYSHLYGSNGSGANPAFGKQLRNNSREYVGLTLNIPLFNRFQTRNNVRAAKLNIENEQLILDNVKLALYKEIQQAYQSAVAAQSKFTSTEKALFAAEEAYSYAEQRYELGKSSVFEFNEAQTKLLTSKSEQIQAKYDFMFRAKILDFYRGEPIDIN